MVLETMGSFVFLGLGLLIVWGTQRLKNRTLKLCLSVALTHHFILHGFMQSYVNSNFPELVSILNGIPFSLGSTALVTIGVYFTVLFFDRRRNK